MDSVTQIALGAGVAEAVLGRRIGNRAALLGAVFGTLPDLDSFIPYGDAVATVTYHRSFSHSLIVLALLSPLFAWLVARTQRRYRVPYRSWWLLVFLVLITHPLLDFFTVYGTQLLWPLYDYPFSGSTVFIVDPAYTLPLGLGVLLALFLPRDSRRRRWCNAVGLTLSSLYLAWTVAAKFHIETRVREELERQDIAYESLLSTPALLNSVLWRLVVMVDGGYYDAYYSVLDAPHRVDFEFHADSKELLEGLEGHWPVQRLLWFTHGFYSVHPVDNALVMSDLRMGVEGAYIFSYQVAERDGEGYRPVSSRQMPEPLRSGEFDSVLRRTFNPVR